MVAFLFSQPFAHCSKNARVWLDLNASLMAHHGLEQDV